MWCSSTCSPWRRQASNQCTCIQYGSNTGPSNEVVKVILECLGSIVRGAPLSPTLFSLYLTTSSRWSRAPLYAQLSGLPVKRVPAILYTDDLALEATSLDVLQAQLDLLHACAANWRLDVTSTRQRGSSIGSQSQTRTSSFDIHVCSDDIVNSCKHLGVKMRCTKPFARAALHCSEAAESAKLPRSPAALGSAAIILPW